jgi:hypothetical protein
MEKWPDDGLMAETKLKNKILSDKQINLLLSFKNNVYNRTTILTVSKA